MVWSILNKYFHHSFPWRMELGQRKSGNSRYSHGMCIHAYNTQLRRKHNDLYQTKKKLAPLMHVRKVDPTALRQHHAWYTSGWLASVVNTLASIFFPNLVLMIIEILTTKSLSLRYLIVGTRKRSPNSCQQKISSSGS